MYGGRDISSLLFADDIVPLASSMTDLLLLLGQLEPESEAAGRKVRPTDFNRTL